METFMRILKELRYLLADAAAQAYLVARGEMSWQDANTMYLLTPLGLLGMYWIMRWHSFRVMIARAMGRMAGIEEALHQPHPVYNIDNGSDRITCLLMTIIVLMAALIGGMVFVYVYYLV